MSGGIVVGAIKLATWTWLAAAIVAVTVVSVVVARFADPRVKATGPPTLSDYVTIDGARPRRMPGQYQNGLLGLRLGSPLGQVEDLLGRPTEIIPDRLARDGEGTVQYWDRSGLWFSLHVNRVSAVTQMTVASMDSNARIGLPRGLVLGEVTLIGAIAAYRRPDWAGWWHAENTTFYEFMWQDGPEGTELLKYGISVDGGYVPLAVEELCGMAVTSYTLSHGSLPLPKSGMTRLDVTACVELAAGSPSRSGGSDDGSSSP